MTAVRGDYQDSICKRARNRGHNDHAGAYLRYAEDLHGVMRGCFFFSRWWRVRQAMSDGISLACKRLNLNQKNHFFWEGEQTCLPVLMCGMMSHGSKDDTHKTRREVNVTFRSCGHENNVQILHCDALLGQNNASDNCLFTYSLDIVPIAPYPTVCVMILACGPWG